MRKQVTFIFLLCSLFAQAQSSNFTATNIRAEQSLRVGASSSQKIAGFDLTMPGTPTNTKLPTSKCVYDWVTGNVVLSGATANGDLSGTYPNPTVDGLMGRPLSATAPTLLDVLKWSGSQWVPATDDNTTYSAGAGLSLTGTTFANTAPSLWTDGGANTYLTATSDNVAIGTSTANSKLDVTTNSLGVTQTNTSGIVLSNNGNASPGAQQISPAIRWRGQGWKTTATAASQTVDFRSYVLPVQGTTAPSGKLVFESSINGGAYSSLAAITSAGYGGFGTVSPATVFHAKAPSGDNSCATYEWTTTPGGAAAKMLIDAIWNDRVRIAPVTTGSEAGTLVLCSSSSQSLQLIDSGREFLFTPFGVTLRSFATGTGALGYQTSIPVWHVRGASGQTANLEQWENSAGTILSSVDAAGKMVIGSSAAASDHLEVYGNARVDGVLASTRNTSTLAAAATTLAVTRNVVTVTGDAGGNTLATITGGKSGQILTLIFVDSNVTITDNATGTANTVNLSAAFTSTANDTITLVFDGTSWRECFRSAN